MRLTMMAISLSAVLAVTYLLAARNWRAAVPPRRAAQRSSAERSAIYAPGRVEGRTREVELRPELTGRIEQLYVHPGDLVSACTPLVRLDAQPYQLEVDLAAAKLSLCEARLDRLLKGARQEERDELAAVLRARLAAARGMQHRWQRTKNLRERDAVAQQEADDVQAQYEAALAEAEAAAARRALAEAPPREDEVAMAEAEVAAAQARLGQARYRLHQTTLRAPIDGQVLHLEYQPGELVGPHTALPVVIMADTSRLHVRAFVEEFDAPRIRIGMTASCQADGLPGKQFRGRVVRLSPRMGRKESASEQPAEYFDTRVREVWIELEDADELVVGLRVDVMLFPPDPAHAR
ncbi:MAG: efflux RND transporter periplasmic adaptor subunit [Pirellulales bacterium]|nr:efflux RND transporter periplasmic adaptor subunit [Pirellulales bacterium]